MHRISHEKDASENLLNNEGLLPIGWSILKGSKAERVLNNAKEMNISDFAKDFVEIGNEIDENYLTARRSHYLYRFLRLEEKNKVLVPRPGNIWICEVIGQPQSYTHPEGRDIGFVVPVKVLQKDISRNHYVPAELSSKLKYRGTNLILNQKDIDEVEVMLSDFYKDRPIYDFKLTKKTIVDKIHDYLIKLNDIHFEKVIKAYFLSIGADIVKIPDKKTKSEDNANIADVDVKAAFNNLGLYILVQAKRHKGRSNDFGVRQLLAYENEIDGDFEHLQPFMWYITTAEVDDSTLELAQDNSEKNIRVIQHKEFASLLVESGFVFSNDIFN